MRININYKMPYNKIIISLFIILNLIELKAQVADDLFQSGNEKYGRAEYNEAIIDYKQIVDNGYKSFELFYNLGNAYFRTNDIANAILYYEKAKKINPDDEDIKTNLKIVKLRTVDKIEEIDDFFLSDISKDISYSLGLEVWTFLSLLFIWITFGIGILFKITKSSTLKKNLFLYSIILILSTFLTFYFSNQLSNELYDDSFAIVMESSVYIKSSPDAGSTDLFILHEGAKLKIINNRNAWSNIRLANGKTGWLPGGSIKKI